MPGRVQREEPTGQDRTGRDGEATALFWCSLLNPNYTCLECDTDLFIDEDRSSIKKFIRWQNKRLSSSVELNVINVGRGGTLIESQRAQNWSDVFPQCGCIFQDFSFYFQSRPIVGWFICLSVTMTTQILQNRFSWNLREEWSQLILPEVIFQLVLFPFLSHFEGAAFRIVIDFTSIYASVRNIFFFNCSSTLRGEVSRWAPNLCSI